MKFFLLAFVAATSAMSLRTMGGPPAADPAAAAATAAAAAAEEAGPPKPVAWLKDTLPACPDDKNRTIMDDGKTHIVKFPYVGAVCALQIDDTVMIQIRDLDTYDAINLNEVANRRE